MVFANSNHTDKSAHMRSMVSAYVVRFLEKVIAIFISVFSDDSYAQLSKFY